MPWVGVILSAIAAAWSLITGAAAIFGVTLLVAALNSISTSPRGSIPAETLQIMNFYTPLSETFTLLLAYLAISGAMFVVRWTFVIRK